MAREAEKSGRESGKAKTEGSETRAAGGASKSASGGGEDKTEEKKAGQPGVGEYQAERHQELQAALAKRSEDGANMPAIVKEFAALWLPHHMVEVELLVPALEDADVDEDKMAAVAVRKDLLNILLADLIRSGAVDGASAKLGALSDTLDAVIAASQQEAEAMSGKIDNSTLNELGPQMKARYERLKKERFADIDESIGEAMSWLAPRSLSVSSGRQQRQRESEMPRNSSMPDRDEQGRFLPEDERRYSRGGGGYRGGQERDEEGRFMSEGRRSRSRYEDEDEGRYGGGRRSMGSDRDEDERGGYGGGRRSMGRDRDKDEGGGYGGGRRSMGLDRDEDERGRYSSRSSGEGRGRGHGGWYGDPEGHSEASRRGWERSEHGESGWYGDREGHSEASRRGWEEGHRSQRRDEDDERNGRRSEGGGRYGRSAGYEDEDRRGGQGGRYESRRGGGRYEDDDERSGRSRGGHGGWSGDLEGHAEAARRGWEHRR